MTLLLRPGASPFHCKGTLWINLQDFIRDHVPGGMPSVQARLDPIVRVYLTQHFVAVGWYDAMPVRPVTEAIALVEGMTWNDSLRERARWVADRHASGIFRLLLRVASAEAVATRLPKVPLRLFDFGHAGGRVVGPRRFSGTIGGFPSMLGPWLGPTVEGYAGKALELGGAKDFRCELHPLVADGEKAGIETVTLGFTFTWS